MGQLLSENPYVNKIERFNYEHNMSEWHIYFDAKNGYDEVCMSINSNHTYYCGFLDSILNHAIPKSLRKLVLAYLIPEQVSL